MAQLKQLVDRPDVVEMHDVTAQDPKLLVHLKVGGGGRGGTKGRKERGRGGRRRNKMYLFLEVFF